MPCTRPILAVFAVSGLLAAGCGGSDGSSPAERSADAISEAATPSQQADREQDTSAPSAAEAGAQDESQPDATITEGGPVRIQLGNRFDWCAEVQAVWDDHDELRDAFYRAHAAAVEAESAYVSATDELDRAEARETASEANSLRLELARDYESAFITARRQLEAAAQRGQLTVERSEDIAFNRAWQALSVVLDPEDVDVLMAHLNVTNPFGPRTTTTLRSISSGTGNNEVHYSYTVLDWDVPVHLHNDPEIVAAWRLHVDSLIAADATFLAKGGELFVYLDNSPLMSTPTTIVTPTTEPADPDEYFTRLREEREASVQEREIAHRAARDAYEATRDRILRDRQAESDRIQIRADEIYNQLLSGNAAYTAFRRTFQESCQS